MEYVLMHKDDRVAILDFDTQLGSLNKIKTLEKNLLPLCAQGKILNDIRPIKVWWQNRSVSKKQSKIRELLRQYDIRSTEKLLLDNLALSSLEKERHCQKSRSSCPF